MPLKPSNPPVFSNTVLLHALRLSSRPAGAHGAEGAPPADTPPDPAFLRGGDAPFEGHGNRSDDGGDINIGDFEMDDDPELQAVGGYGPFAAL